MNRKSRIEWRKQFDKSNNVTCVLDQDSRIVYCNPAWDRFALSNAGDGAVASKVSGVSLFDCIPPVLHDHYRTLLDRARADRKILHAEYECNSPDVYREFQMNITPIPGTEWLALVHSLRVEAPIPYESLPLTNDDYRVDELIVMCAQCRRTRHPTQLRWDWIPDFVRSMPRRVSHGVCDACMVYLYGHPRGDPPDNSRKREW